MWQSATTESDREELAYREGVLDALEILLQLDQMDLEITLEKAAVEIRHALLGDENGQIN